jgi:hypothetical protein
MRSKKDLGRERLCHADQVLSSGCNNRQFFSSSEDRLESAYIKELIAMQSVLKSDSIGLGLESKGANFIKSGVNILQESE